KKEIEEEEKKKAQEFKLTTSTSLKIHQLEDELKTIDSEIETETGKLEALTGEEKKAAVKIEELKKKVSGFEAKAAEAGKKGNKVEQLIHLSSATVREIRLNGLEIPKLNTIKTFIYLGETELETLRGKQEYNGEEISSLKEQGRKELINKLIKGLLIIIIALIFVFLVLSIAQKVSRKVMGRVESSSKIDDHRKQRYRTLSVVALTFTKVAVWAITVLVVLGELEINYAPFMLVAGGISLAFGFGAQSLVKDIVSGFFMLMEEQFALGDSVEIGGVSGSVEKITLRAVKIRSLDGTLHTIPSGSISRVSNRTYQWSRAVVKVGVSYDNDSKKVLDVLSNLAREMAKEPEWKDAFLEEPNAQGILSFDDSAVAYRIVAKTTSGSQWGINRELMVRIKTAFEREGIDIPYNYMNVNVLDHTKAGKE
ncbi:MAG: mechanosensitive ion channel, partial [bacterium]|nr:mechanosensitive ion channel [bacterium]